MKSFSFMVGMSYGTLMSEASPARVRVRVRVRVRGRVTGSGSGFRVRVRVRVRVKGWHRLPAAAARG